MAEELKNLPDYAEESAYLQRTKHVLEQTLRQEKAAVSVIPSIIQTGAV